MKNMNWPVLIEEVDNGYQVQVGCVKLVFERQETLLAELMAYMNGKPTLLVEKLKGEKMPVGIGGIQPQAQEGTCATRPRQMTTK